MAKKKLNAKIVSSMKPALTRIQVFDADQPGLALRVTPDGTKTFSVVYKFRGRMCRLTIGKYPAVMLADARSRARAALRDVERGEDPAAKKAAIREAGTFQELSEIYMAEHSKAKKRSWRQDRRMFDTYLFPTLKYVKASAVTQDDCEGLLEQLATRAPVQANRVRALLRHLYSWALGTRKWRRSFALTVNPCAYVPRLTDETARERVYSDDELKTLWKVFDKTGIIGDLFKLQLMTATRKGELVQMAWKEIDLERAIWTQPGEKTKNVKVHVVPLSTQVVRILESIRQRQSKLKNVSKRKSEFVFHSPRTGTKAMTWLQKAAERVKEDSGIEDFEAHDLRRTAATRLAEMGVPDPVLKMILNHSLGKDVTGVYNQYKYYDERKQALQAWASRLAVIASDLKGVMAGGPDPS